MKSNSNSDYDKIVGQERVYKGITLTQFQPYQKCPMPSLFLGHLLGIGEFKLPKSYVFIREGALIFRHIGYLSSD